VLNRLDSTVKHQDALSNSMTPGRSLKHEDPLAAVPYPVDGGELLLAEAGKLDGQLQVGRRELQPLAGWFDLHLVETSGHDNSDNVGAYPTPSTAAPVMTVAGA
jgi:hypothetical protein